MTFDELCRLVPGLTRRRSLSVDMVRSLLDRRAGECTWCGDPVAKGRRTWCSDDCVIAYQLRCQPTNQRAFVSKRDRQICQLCGRDTRAAAKQFRQHCSERIGVSWSALDDEVARQCGYSRGQFGEVDHIVAVADGGGLLGVDNLRWVCGVCHAARTAEQSRVRKGRRSRRRRS